jgi:hypothetical protein
MKKKIMCLCVNSNIFSFSHTNRAKGQIVVYTKKIQKSTRTMPFTGDKGMMGHNFRSIIFVALF